MLQDVFLFSGTLKENIKLFDETKTDEEMIQAANYVGLNHVIENLNDGY